MLTFFVNWKLLVRIWLDSDLDRDVEKMVDTMYIYGLINYKCYRKFKDHIKELFFAENENCVINVFTGEIFYKRNKYGKLVKT